MRHAFYLHSKDAAMTITTTDFHRSSNGDRWQLIVDTVAGTSMVRHEPNLSSGGQVTETSVAEFLAKSGASPRRVHHRRGRLPARALRRPAP
jgi:hypothetical protein